MSKILPSGRGKPKPSRRGQCFTPGCGERVFGLRWCGRCSVQIPQGTREAFEAALAVVQATPGEAPSASLWDWYLKAREKLLAERRGSPEGERGRGPQGS